MKKLVVCLLAMAMVLCMSFAVISVSAADSEFAPSIEVKDVPTVSGAVIGEEAVEYTITSYKDVAADASNALTQAYKALEEAGVKATITDIDKFATETLKIENAKYYVSNVFELNLKDAAKLEGDAAVTVTFKNDASINAKAGKLIVAHMVDNKWVIVPNEDVKVTAETVEVTFDDLCPVAFVHVEEGEATPAPGGDDKAEDDGLLTATIIILSITAVIILGIVVFYVLEKKGIIGNAAQNNSKKK